MFAKAINSLGARLALILFLIIGMLGTQPIQPVLAATITVSNVNDSGVGSLRGAIAAASPGDTITFDPSLSGQTIILASTVTIDKNMTINGLGMNQLTISGNNVSRVFYINSGVTVTLDSLIIAHGKSPYGSSGGGIFNAGALTVTNSTISENSAAYGGGIFNEGGTVMMIDSTLSYNNVYMYGGGVYSQGGTVTVSNSTLSNNASVVGGGVYNAGGTMMVSNSIFSYNSGDPLMSSAAGGIYNIGTLTISDSTFSNNSAQDSGGGIFHSGGTLTITNSIFSGNSASGYHSAGGGIINDDTLIITNSTFSGNSAEVGGAIYNNGTLGMLTVTDSTFSGNSALDGGGIFNYDTLTVTNSTFSGNGTSSYGSSGGGISNYKTLTVTNSTFFENSATYGGGIRNGDFYNPSTLTVTNSTFSVNSASYGGAIDNAGTLTINNGTFSGNHISQGMGGAIASYRGTLDVTDSTFSNNNAVVNPYFVGGGGEGGAIYTQTVLTVTNSTFDGNQASRGGALSCNSNTSAITSTNSTYVSNSALSDSAGDGGAIYANCHSTIVASTFASNTATHYAGAILTDDDSDLTEITNSTFYDNAALSGSGGGVANYGGLSIKNSTFSNNNASSGGAIRNGLGGFLSLRNSILANSVGGVDCINPDGTPAVENINNLVETTGAGFESCGTPLLSSDPMLGSLTNNGGATQTMALLPASPAINVGNDASCPSADQRGVTRPQGSHCDIGAYEKTATFEDVQLDYWAWSFIERLYDARITGGCSVNLLQYCPEGMVTRAQIAVFLERGIHSSSYTPPTVGASTGFGDVSTTYWAAAWIKQLYADGITGGCGVGIYCPEGAVTRAQMAVFLLRSKHGASYVPPAVGSSTGFGDVSTTYWAAAWIKQLVAEGITSGCGSGTYCPEAPVTRAQMAVFLVRTFGLP
jgi:parallel beta helix pectate lyase-like protein/S-layer family protein/polymorphic membrane protein